MLKELLLSLILLISKYKKMSSKSVFIIGAGASKSYSQSITQNRMPIANDFFKIYSRTPSLSTNRWVLVGKLINYLRDYRNIDVVRFGFPDDLDIEELHSEIFLKFTEAVEHIDKVWLQGVYMELIFLFSSLINEIQDGPVSRFYTNLISKMNKSDSIITFNWDCLIDRSLFETKKWSPMLGYGIEAKNFYYGSGWVNKLEQKTECKTKLLKLHGSTNWIKKYTTLSSKGMVESYLSKEEATLNVYIGADGPYSTYDGRWDRQRSDFSYGYYPPNLRQVGSQANSSDKIRLLLLPRSPIHAPPGRGPNAGQISMPLIVPPVKNKNYEIYGSFFTNLWKNAEIELIHADKVYILGYSFPITDTASIALLKNSFSVNRQTHFIIVNPNPEGVEKQLKDNVGINSSNITVHKRAIDDDDNLDFLHMD